MVFIADETSDGPDPPIQTKNQSEEKWSLGHLFKVLGIRLDPSGRVRFQCRSPLLFLLPHPLPQLLPDVRQRVLFAGQRSDGVAEAADLRLPESRTGSGSGSGSGSARSAPFRQEADAYRTLRFWDRFI